jgi:pSer/pThr/pTyr-binding forkhead associated (FHA) protein
MANDGKTKTVSRTPGKGMREEPYLIVLAGGSIGIMHQLRADAATLIGRGLDADVRLEDDGVSRRHAKITLAAGADPVLEDMGSSNGTFVNGERIQKHVLKDGDKVQIGSISILKFSYQDDLERTFQQQLFDRGIKDGLTNIYNKKYFLDRIDSEYAHARRHKRDLSLLLFDIDNFNALRWR